MWSEVLLLFCSFLSIALLYLKSDSSFPQVSIFASVTILSIIVSFSPALGLPFAEGVTEWAKITGITFALLVLASLIRYFKPLYARYPAAFSFTPIIIMIFYPFITDAVVLKDLLNQILQGGALLISLLLYLTLRNKMQGHLVLLAAILVFIASYVLYWFGSELSSVTPWLWQLFMATGVIAFSQSLTEIPEAVEQ